MENIARKVTKAERVLHFIGSDPDGKTMKEIQTFVLKMNGVQKWLEKGYLEVNPVTCEIERTRAGRGYWTDYLYGTGWSEAGFLRTHCTKLPTGRWKLTEPVVGPWRGKKTKSFQFNVDHERGARQRYLESLPKCPHCKRAINKNDVLCPDDQACFTQMSGAYNVDCSGRVWWKETMSYCEKRMKLCKFSKSEVMALAEMARKLHSKYEDQLHALWRMLGENLSDQEVLTA